jgi:hypothetical protein
LFHEFVSLIFKVPSEALGSEAVDRFERFELGSSYVSEAMERLERLEWASTGDLPNIKYDSAEKPSVHPSRASGRTEEQLKSLEFSRSC